MYVTNVLSYLGGWDLLRDQKANELDELSLAVSHITLEGLYEFVERERISRQYQYPLDPAVLQRMGDRYLEGCAWNKHRIRPVNPNGLGVYIKRWKNGVGARFFAYEIIGTSNFVNWVMVDVPRAHDLNACGLSVLLVPMKDVRDFLDNRGSRIRSLFSYERCIGQLTDLLPLRHSAPFVVIGFSQRDRQFELFEIETDPPLGSEGDETIEKSIEFPQEYYQAGVSILSYFGEVLKQKHPSLRAKVRIEQDGLIVRLYIESETGAKEIIEKTLEEYGLVVAERIPPEVLFESRLQIVALEQKLELAKAEVRYTQQLLSLAEGAYKERIVHLQDEVHHLRSYIGQQLMQNDRVHGLLAHQCETNEKLLLAHVSQAESLIQNLIRQSEDNQSVLEALTLIDQKLTDGVKPTDEEAVKRALAVIHREKPSIFTQLQSVFLNLSYEVSGGYLFKWIEAFVRQV